MSVAHPAQIPPAAATTASVAPSAEPATWSFINRHSGAVAWVTCMPGCTNDHTLDWETPTFPEDVWCETDESTVSAYLPMNTGREIDEMRVLGVALRVNPFSEVIAERLPHADLAVSDDRVIEGLDPDGLETVINTIAARLEHLREAHARLVTLRVEYKRQRHAIA